MCSTAQPIYHHLSPVAVTPPDHADVTMHMTNSPTTATHFDPLSPSPTQPVPPSSFSTTVNTSPRTPLALANEENNTSGLVSRSGNPGTSPALVSSSSRSRLNPELSPDPSPPRYSPIHNSTNSTVGQGNINQSSSITTKVETIATTTTTPHSHHLSDHRMATATATTMTHNMSRHNSHTMNQHSNLVDSNPNSRTTSSTGHSTSSWDATKEGPFWCRWHGCSLTPANDVIRFQSNSTKPELNESISSTSSSSPSPSSSTDANNTNNGDDDKMFTDGHAIWQHILAVHLTPRPRRGHAFTCRWMNCTFTSLTGAYGAEMHLRGHLDWHPYCCKMCGVRFKRRGDYAKHMREKHSMRPGRDSQSPEPISPPVNSMNNGATTFDMMMTMMTPASSSPDDTLRDIPGHHRPLSPASLRRVSLDSGYASYHSSSSSFGGPYRGREPRRSFDYAPSVMTRPMSAIGHRYHHPYHHSHHYQQQHPHQYSSYHSHPHHHHPHSHHHHDMNNPDPDSLHRQVMAMDQKHRPAAIAAIIENGDDANDMSSPSAPSPHYSMSASSYRELPPVRVSSSFDTRDRCPSSGINRPGSSSSRDPFFPQSQLPHSASQDHFYANGYHHSISPSPLRPPSVPLPPHLPMPMSASSTMGSEISSHKYNSHNSSSNHYDYNAPGAPSVSWERPRWSPPLRPLSTPAGPSPQQLSRPSVTSPLTGPLPSFSDMQLGQTPMQRHQSSAAIMENHSYNKDNCNNSNNNNNERSPTQSYYSHDMDDGMERERMMAEPTILAVPEPNRQAPQLITKVEAVASINPISRQSYPPRELYRLLHEENVVSSHNTPSLMTDSTDSKSSQLMNVLGSGQTSSVSKRPRSHTLENMNDPGVHLHPSQRTTSNMSHTETAVLMAVDQITTLEEEVKSPSGTSLYQLFMSLHRIDTCRRLSSTDAKQLLSDLTERMADWDQVLSVMPTSVMIQIFKRYAELRSYVDDIIEDEKKDSTVDEMPSASPIDILASAAESVSRAKVNLMKSPAATITTTVSNNSVSSFAFPSVRPGHRLRAYCIIEKEPTNSNSNENDETERHFLFDVTANNCKMVEMPKVIAQGVNGRWIDALCIDIHQHQHH